jgi:hypothetical protein
MKNGMKPKQPTKERKRFKTFFVFFFLWLASVGLVYLVFVSGGHFHGRRALCVILFAIFGWVLLILYLFGWLRIETSKGDQE